MRTGVKIIVGLGNPGPKYDATRHNVGWWVLDRLAYDWDLPPFVRSGPAVVTEGRVGEHRARLVKPTTFMNRSGAAVTTFADVEAFDPSADLLVIVDDAALPVGRVRLRPRGRPGGHNGLKSMSGALRSDDYARLRIGVGVKPEGADLSDWVLSPMPEEDEDVVVGLLPGLTQAVETWMTDGVEVAMSRFNR